MIVVMRKDSNRDELEGVQRRIETHGLTAHVSEGVERTIVGVLGQTFLELKDELERLPGVLEVVPISKSYKLSSREFKEQDTVIRVRDVEIGSDEVVVMAGPCAVEDEEQVMSTAHLVKTMGAKVLRGGAFKPRTSPYSFRGMGVQGLQLLANAGKETGLPVVTEVMTPEDVGMVAEYADILQIGTRNAQNFNLLDAVGKIKKPVLLKRGFARLLRGVAPCRRIRAFGGQQPGDPVRTRHQDFRDRDSLYPGPGRHSGNQGLEPPAGYRRPEPQHGEASACSPDDPCGCGGGSSWRHRGRASQPSGCEV